MQLRSCAGMKRPESHTCIRLQQQVRTAVEDAQAVVTNERIDANGEAT